MHNPNILISQHDVVLLVVVDVLSSDSAGRRVCLRRNADSTRENVEQYEGKIPKTFKVLN